MPRCACIRSTARSRITAASGPSGRRPRPNRRRHDSRWRASTIDAHERNKHRVLELQHGLAGAEPEQAARALAAASAPDFVWNGPHPFDTVYGSQAVAERFWAPLAQALPALERRDDIVLAGSYGGSDWVACMGHLVGTFERAWLGIPPTGRVLFLRFGELHRMDAAGTLEETFVIYDLLGVMLQAGVDLLPPSLGAELTAPGPSTRDGVQLGSADPEETRRTVELVDAMLFEGLGARAGSALNQAHDIPYETLANYWHPQMMWYGPSGIGTTRGIEGFKRGHQIPFRYALTERDAGYHTARFAEGRYCVSCGWPSYHATHGREGWLGMTPTGRRFSMRVMDFWRREDDLLVENWVFIDLLDALEQLGHDLLGTMRERVGGR